VRTRFVEKLGEVDADKDGAVTVDEFAQTVPALNVGITVEEARAVFSLLDVMKATYKHMLQCTCLFTHVISTRAPYVCNGFEGLRMCVCLFLVFGFRSKRAVLGAVAKPYSHRGARGYTLMRACIQHRQIMGDGKLNTEELLVALNADVANPAAAAAAPDLLSTQSEALVRTPSVESRSMLLVQEALLAKGAGLMAGLREMDSNNDGEISSREFCKAVNRLEGIDVTQTETAALYKHLVATRPLDSNQPAKTTLTIDAMGALFGQVPTSDHIEADQRDACATVIVIAPETAPATATTAASVEQQPHMQPASVASKPATPAATPAATPTTATDKAQIPAATLPTLLIAAPAAEVVKVEKGVAVDVAVGFAGVTNVAGVTDVAGVMDDAVAVAVGVAAEGRVPAPLSEALAPSDLLKTVQKAVRLRGTSIAATFKAQVSKRATKYRALLLKMTYKDKGSYESSPPCI